jgi:hypothetical protein
MAVMEELRRLFLSEMAFLRLTGCAWRAGESHPSKDTFHLHVNLSLSR